MRCSDLVKSKQLAKLSLFLESLQNKNAFSRSEEVTVRQCGRTKRKLLHIHRQYVYQNLDIELKFFRNSSDWRLFMTGLLTDIYEECETRTEFGREKPRPIVKIPLTSDFNEEVCIDLKEWKLKDYRYILCMVDKYIRYIMAMFVRNKEAETICAAMKN